MSARTHSPTRRLRPPWGSLGLVVLTGLLMGATCGTRTSEPLPETSASAHEVLGPGDVIELRVFGEPDLSGTHQLSANGTIRVPLIGNVEAGGLTPDELSARLEKAFNETYLKAAEVSLLVKEFNSRKVYVLGQVSKPGPYLLDGRMTLIDAIAKAGGTTKLADSDRTLVTRKKDDGTQARVIVQMTAIVRGQAPDVTLAPGDVVFVPESPL